MVKTNQEKLREIKRHTDLVEFNCRVLGYKLMEQVDNGTVKFGITRNDVLHLFQLGKIHDSDKLSPYIFDHLWPENEKFIEALFHHQKISPHHPEFWEHGILQMSTMYLAEMVCDCAARAQEFGTDVRDWFKNQATVKYEFSWEPTGVSYIDDVQLPQKLEYFMDLLLTKKFS